VVYLKDTVDFNVFFCDCKLAYDFTCALPDPLIRKFDLQKRQRAPNSFLSTAETQSNSRFQAVLYLVFFKEKNKNSLIDHSLLSRFFVFNKKMANNFN
jgi:hypothetical protein